MLLGDLVGFKNELFFEGAVQLRWVEEKPEKAAEAAENFVFHGPRYHGVHQDDSNVISSAYKLKDTATFILELLESFVANDTNNNTNPLSLAVAGYGSGKSHFALTVAKLLMAPDELLACKIIGKIMSADNDIGERVQQILGQIEKPSLVVTLDGMSNFHLGSELSRSIISQLKSKNLDLGPILELSPRFTYAGDFVERNYEFRIEDFEKQLKGLSKDLICSKLQEHDENIYQVVDDIYYKANGTWIPVDGRESAQDLINTVCDSYCGENGCFSNLIILFDEFGRYLEYAADKPRLAGDSSLQQIFQGIQDNAKLTRFVGFIQYELKAYLNRFSYKELSHLQRYITRFDSANKLYLSSNLETLFAHLIEKKSPSKLKLLIESDINKKNFSETHNVLCGNLPGIGKLPVWNNYKTFMKVIVEGCWPLHPLTTWFLTRQQDIVQSRSALTFIKDVLDAASRQQIDLDGNLYSIPPAELVIRSMLQEIVAAEQAQSGIIAETLQSLLDKYKAKLDEPQKLVLAGIMILDKLRISTKEKGQVDRLLQLATGLTEKVQVNALKFLSNVIGTVEWNNDLCQYELVADAVTRGQFQQVMNRKLQGLAHGKIGELFNARAKTFGDLVDIDSDFSESKEISSRDWKFSAMHAHGSDYFAALSRAFEEWKVAEHHDEAKGRVIYLYLSMNEDPDAYLEKTKEFFNALLSKYTINAAPLWTIIIHDKDEKIADNLSRLHVLDDEFQPDELVRFQRFIPEEKERSSRTLREEIQDVLRQRMFIVAGIDEVANLRLNPTARWIFEQIYPNTLPFPFDGFQLRTGTGPKDCAQLIKALIGRQVSGDWIATQITAFQNRFRRLFVQAWQVMGNDGKIRLKPGLKKLADLLDVLESEHAKNRDMSVFDSYTKLLKPPYGFNTSSVGLIYGLLLARETPPRALKYKGENIALQDWLGLAFPARGIKPYLDSNCLKLTKIIFLTEDSLQKWRKILSELEYEENLRKKIDMFTTAKTMNRNNPIPEILEGKYQFCAQIVEQAKVLLGDHLKKIDSLERDIERALRLNNISQLIRYGAELKKYQRFMETQATFWTVEDFDGVKNIFNILISSLDGKVAPWIELQACNSFQTVPDFRFNMDRTAKDLQILEFKTDADLVDRHKSKIINQVESRMKFETSIATATDLIRQPAPKKTTTLWKLKEETKTCDALIENLRLAYKQIGGADIAKLISQIENIKESVKICMKQQRDDLTKIANEPLINIIDIKSILQKVNEHACLFKGSKDESDINDMLNQLSIIKYDMQAWNGIIMSPEETDETLTDQIIKRCKVLGEGSVDDENYVWDYNVVYSNFKNYIVKYRHLQSDKWITTVRPNIDKIKNWNLSECEKQLSIIADRPKFLSTAHVAEIIIVEEKIRSKVAEIKEQCRLDAAIKWIQNIQGQIKDKDQLTLEDCERLSRTLEKVPDFISDVEIHHIIGFRALILKRQDELDINSIISRICKLNEKLRVGLFRELHKLYNYE